MLSKEKINELNKKIYKLTGDSEQGIYNEPYGIPDNIKEPVVYMRYEQGGVSGGSYHDNSNPQYYSNSTCKDDFIALDVVIEEIKPNISYMDYKKIKRMVVSSEETEYEYYGNRTDWEVKFIKLNDLLSYLNKV